MLKPRRSSLEKVDTTGDETMASTTGTFICEEETESAVAGDEEKKDEEKETIEEEGEEEGKEDEEEIVERDEPDTSQVTKVRNYKPGAGPGGGVTWITSHPPFTESLVFHYHLSFSY